MNSHQKSELNYWQYKKDELGGKEAYLKYRSTGYAYRIEQFPEFESETGKGLDLGCGMVSVFEWSDKDVVAVDPLIDGYNDICRIDNPRVEYVRTETELLPFKDDSFDWVFCYNVIDHTPDPKLMASEAYRVLKPGGRLYFMVNFDEIESPSHYGLWNEDTVAGVMKQFKAIYTKTRPGEKRSLYFAKYVK